MIKDFEDFNKFKDELKGWPIPDDIFGVMKYKKEKDILEREIMALVRQFELSNEVNVTKVDLAHVRVGTACGGIELAGIKVETDFITRLGF